MNIKKILLVIVIALSIISLLFIVFSTRKSKLGIVSTNPQNGQENIVLSVNVDIAFNQIPTDKEKGKISYHVSPDITSEATWLTNTYKIVPKESLKPATRYTISITYAGVEISSFSFETTLFTDEQLQKEGALQTKDDYVFAAAYRKFIDSYPWYQKLPIEKKEYRIIYDFERKSFRIRFKEVFSETQKAALVKQALLDLREIGVVDTTNYYTLNPDQN